MIEQVYNTLPKVSGQVALLFTGGMESSLMASILIDKYGRDNVVLVLMAMDEYNVFRAKPDKLKRVVFDFHTAAKRVGAAHTFVIDNDVISEFAGTIPSRVMSSIVKFFPRVQYTFDGYNNIHKESIDLFHETEFDHLKRNDVKRAKIYLATHQHVYPELYDFVFKCDGIIYFVEDDYTLKTRSDVVGECTSSHISPLISYTKADVVTMYKEAGLLELLYQTKSCNSSDVHCGVCKNCLNRKYAFGVADVEDKTEYLV